MVFGGGHRRGSEPVRARRTPLLWDGCDYRVESPDDCLATVAVAASTAWSLAAGDRRIVRSPAAAASRSPGCAIPPNGTAAGEDLERLASRVQELRELQDVADRAIAPDPDTAVAREQAARREDRAATVAAAAAATHERRDELAERLADAGLEHGEVHAQVLGAVVQPDAPSAAVTPRRAPRAGKAPTVRWLERKQQRRR